MAASGKYDALICLGAVIRGDTPHFEYIAREVAAGVSRAMIEHRIPVSFGVLTTDNLEQALERSAPNQGNKGYEAALTAIEMAHLNRAVP
jgi:6,7-dimethyl-8-ribityllumazine synthase